MQNWQRIDRQLLRSVINHEGPGPCVSLYMPTHRHHPDNKQDPIRFKNLVKEIEASLAETEHELDTAKLLQPLHALQGNELFWNHTSDGLAVLVAQDVNYVLLLPRSVRELAVVSTSFHVKPLLRLVQSADRFAVLTFSRDRARLFEGDRYQLSEVIPGNTVLTIESLLGDELSEPTRTMHRAGNAFIQHGQGSKKDEVDKDTERFLREVDKHIIALTDAPLVVLALAEHQAVYRSVSKYPHLLEQGVDKNGESETAEQILKETWPIVQPQYVNRLHQLVEEFNEAYSKQLGTADLSDAVQATLAGRVKTILIEADREIPGRIDASGQIATEKLENPEIDDLLDDLSELVIKQGGEVVIVPKEQMPTPSGLAAIFRF